MKQLDTTIKKIGEATFYITPFPAFKSANISGDLVKLLTPIVGVIVQILGGEDKDKGDSAQLSAKEKAADIFNQDIDQYIPSLVEAVSTLDGDKIEDMMKKLLINYRNIKVECDATNGDVKVMTYDLANEVFCNELQDMYLLCWEVIKLNFGGFFKKLGLQSGSQKEATQKKIPSLENGASLT